MSRLPVVLTAAAAFLAAAAPATALTPRKLSYYTAGPGRGTELIGTSADRKHLRWGSYNCVKGTSLLVFGFALRRDGSFRYAGSTDPKSVGGVVKVTIKGRFTSPTRISLTTECGGVTRHYKLRFRGSDAGYPKGFGKTNPNAPVHPKPPEPVFHDAHQAGRYAGTTAEGRAVSFEESGGGILHFTFPGLTLNCPDGSTAPYGSGDIGGAEIRDDGSFHIEPPSGGGTTRITVDGRFSSATTVTGTIDVSAHEPPNQTCTASVSFSAAHT